MIAGSCRKKFDTSTDLMVEVQLMLMLSKWQSRAILTESESPEKKTAKKAGEL
jgi:hypothetical protein